MLSLKINRLSPITFLLKCACTGKYKIFPHLTFSNWIKMQFPRLLPSKRFYVIRIQRGRFRLFVGANRGMNGARWRPAHTRVYNTRLDSPAIGWMRACRRLISRAKLFITEVHIRASSGRPALQARLGGNFHFRWQRMQTPFEEMRLLFVAAETFCLRRHRRKEKLWQILLTTACK